jgi:hypothetical protein
VTGHKQCLRRTLSRQYLTADELSFQSRCLNLIQEEIKRNLNSGNACYHSVHNIFHSRLLFNTVKIKIYKSIILPVVLYGWKTWSLVLREDSSLRVFENRMLRRIFRPKRDGVTGGWKRGRV